MEKITKQVIPGIVAEIIKDDDGNIMGKGLYEIKDLDRMKSDNETRNAEIDAMIAIAFEK